jgi:hypothetical protein
VGRGRGLPRRQSNRTDHFREIRNPRKARASSGTISADAET